MSTNPDVRTRPAFDHLPTIAKMLDVSIDYLIGLTDDYDHASDATEPRDHRLDWTILIQNIIDEFENEIGVKLPTKVRLKWVKKAYFLFSEKALPNSDIEINDVTLRIRRIYGDIN